MAKKLIKEVGEKLKPKKPVDKKPKPNRPTKPVKPKRGKNRHTEVIAIPVAQVRSVEEKLAADFGFVASDEPQIFTIPIENNQGRTTHYACDLRGLTTEQQAILVKALPQGTKREKKIKEVRDEVKAKR